MNEVNVKEIKFVDGAAGVLVKKVKCDFKNWARNSASR